MECFINTKSCTFDCLEIKTKDAISLYVPRTWVLLISPYFKSLLSNGCIESYDNYIYLDYHHNIIVLLFDIIYNSFHGDKYIYDNYFSKLKTNDYYNFISALTEYQLFDILNSFDNYLQNQDIENYLSYKFIDIILKFDKPKTKKIIVDFLNNNFYCLKFFNYSKINYNFLEIFYHINRISYLKLLLLWAKNNKPIDRYIDNSMLLTREFWQSFNSSPYFSSKFAIELAKCIDNTHYKFLLYEIILNNIYNSHRYQQKLVKCKNYKDFIRKCFESNNSCDDDLKLMVKIIKKWYNENPKPLNFLDQNQRAEY